MNPIDHPCQRCHVPAGVKCKNYKGQGKQACPERGKRRHQQEAPVEEAKDAARPTQSELF